MPDPNTNLKSGQAGLTIDWVTQPEVCPGSAGVQVAEAKITLLSGGPALAVALSSKIVGAYTCGGLGIGSFEGPPPPVEQPVVLALPEIVLKVPSSARAGHARGHVKVRGCGQRKSAPSTV